MDKDRLEEAKQYFNLTMNSVITEYGIDLGHWLISELEACRAENAELNALFKLQHSRSQKAESMWQAATNNPGTLPDLGTLLEWLMGELEECRAEVKRQKGRGRRLIRLHRDEMSAQAARLSKVINQGNEDCKYWTKQAEKFKKRIGELLVILQKHGVADV